MFPVSITLHNPAQLNAVMAALALQAPAEPTVADLTQQALQRAAHDKPDAPAPEVAASAPKPGKPSSPTSAATTAAPAPSSPTAEGAAATAAPAKTAAAPGPTAASAVAAAPASTAATEVTYDQVARAITETVKTDRPRVLAALAQFGAKKGPELKPEQYADFLKALQEEATA